MQRLKMHNISYHEIGAIVGVHSNTICNWLRGDSKTEVHIDELINAYKVIDEEKIKNNKISINEILIGRGNQ